MSDIFSRIGKGDWNKAKKNDSQNGDYYRPSPGMYIGKYDGWEGREKDTGGAWIRLDFVIDAGPDEGKKISMFQTIIKNDGDVSEVGLRILQQILQKLGVPIEDLGPSDCGEALNALNETMPRVRLKVKPNKDNPKYDDIRINKVLDISTTGAVIDFGGDDDDVEEAAKAVATATRSKSRAKKKTSRRRR